MSEGTRRKDHMLEIVLDALSFPVFVLGIEEIVYANAAAADLLKCPEPSTLRGTPVTRIVHPDSHEATAERRRLVIEKRNHFKSVFIKLLASDGTCLRCTADVKPIEHDGQVFVMATLVEAHQPSN